MRKPIPHPSTMLSDPLNPFPPVLLKPASAIDWATILEKSIGPGNKNLAEMDQLGSGVPFAPVSTTASPVVVAIVFPLAALVLAATAATTGVASTAVKQ
jgi:hypothetical protein